MEIAVQTSRLETRTLMHTFQETLKKEKFLILDGAVATELEKKGANLNDPLWSAKVLLEQPELIRETHLDYLEAGADIICTTTYQATFEGFQKRGIDREKAVGLFKLSVELAQEAREIHRAKSLGQNRFVAASIGPYGAYLADGSEYTGDYRLNKNGLKAFHRDRLELMIGLGVDLLLFETIPNLEETSALAELLDEMPAIPVLFSFSCKDAGHIRDGAPLAEAGGIAANSRQTEAVGVNCIHPSLVSPSLSELDEALGKPLLAYPNNGDLWDAKNKCWVDGDDRVPITSLWGDWLEKGAKILGGCCRTTPSDIRHLSLFKDNHS